MSGFQSWKLVQLVDLDGEVVPKECAMVKSWISLRMGIPRFIVVNIHLISSDKESQIMVG